MQEAAYLDAAYDRRFDGTVDRAINDRIVLTRTLFYPTGGGQPHDTGTIVAGDRTFRVVDVTRRDRIYHTLEPVEAGSTSDGSLLDVGTPVTGQLDWERRYAHMRYHTAQHLLSAILLDEYDAPTTGNQLYADRARIDCAYDRFTAGDIADIEARMNDLVTAALPVRCRTLPRDEAEAELDPDRTRLDLLPDHVTDVRIVEIGDLDRTACAGTHVESTEEVGTVSVTGRETRGADEERLRFEISA